VLPQISIVDHELRFTPMLLTARRLLREGVIGTVSAVHRTARACIRFHNAYTRWSYALRAPRPGAAPALCQPLAACEAEDHALAWI